MKKLTLIICLIAMTLTASAQQVAFPGAQGFGRFAKGARASSSPTVYHVTNLNDSGSGSLRDAVSQSNRIVVFDVSGVIKINSRIVFKSNLYVAGQTAPGEGVTVYGNGVSFSGASNIICRYLRVRMGHGGDSGKDCAGIANGTNMIFDHCSFSWGLDETFSINSDGGALGDITLQNCIFGQGLLSHSAGGLMQADNITLYRNFYCDNSTRNNKVKGKNQYANNVVYNWQNGCYIMGGDSEGQSYCNIQSNLFINGPAKGGDAFGGGNSNFHFYADDNWQDSNLDGVFNPSLITKDGGGDRVQTPYAYPELELFSGKELLEKSIPTVGASLPYRDQSDCYMVDEVMSLGKQGKIITYETSLPIGAPDTWNWWKGTKPADADGDGMPDAWETANGTNPNSNDATVIADNGYLNIENYINSISADSRQYFLRAPITLTLAKATLNSLEISWRDYTYAEEGFAVEVQKNGSWVEVGTTAANATSYTITDLEAAKKYGVRVRAFGTDNGNKAYSEYATGEFTTRQGNVETIDIATFVPDYTLGDNQTEWNSETTDWKEGYTYTDDSKVLLNTSSNRTLTISGDPMPTAVVVNGTGNLTLSGTIMGTGSMNKGNTGTLIMGDAHTYTGPTVIHEGVLEASKLANGGEISSIGSAIADAQNLILNGGTFRYTGGNAATDRGIKVTAPSVLDIASSTLTYNGAIEGNSDITLDGKGTLAVANATTTFKGINGKIHLKDGLLNFTDIENASKPFAGLGKTVVMEGGHIKFAFKNEDNQTHAFPMEIAEGTLSQFDCPNHGTLTSTITGSGTLQFNIPYLRYYYRAKDTDFKGRIIANGTGKDVIFCHDSQFNSPKVPFTLTGTAFMCAWTTSGDNYIGGLSGESGTKLAGSSKQTKGFKCSWTVGGANTDEEFKGTICNLPAGKNSAYSGTTSIVKVGTGDWRLTGNNDYAGTTQVKGGRLIVNGSHTGTGAVTVGNGAELAGKGSIAGAVTVQSGGTITVGDGGEAGKEKLTLNGKLTTQSGATINIPVTTSREAKTTESVPAQATWSYADNQYHTAATSIDAKAFSASNIILGSGVVQSSLKSYTGGDGNYPSDKIVAMFNHPTASSWNVIYSVTAAEDFTATGFETFMLRSGSDGQKVNIFVQVDNGAMTSIGSGIVPKRDNKDKAYETEKGITNPVTEFSKALENVKVPKGSTLKIVFNISATATKEVGFGELKISGTYEKIVENAGDDAYSYVGKASPIVLAGGASIGSGTILNIDIKGSLGDGTTIPVFTTSKTLTGSVPTIVPATPGSGLEWDTTDLLSKGVLKVKDPNEKPSAIRNAGSTKSSKKTAYTLNGQRATGNERGIVVKDGKKVMMK